MTMSAQDVIKCIEGTSEDQLVALIKAIYEAKQKKTCGGCKSSPCCCQPTTCCSCNTSPCCCQPTTCCSCNTSPCCCDPCQPNIGDYLLELGKLNLCFYEQLWEVNRRFHKTIASSFCAPVACAPQPKKCCSGCGKSPCCCGSKKSESIQKTLCLEGQTGHKAIGCFKISNKSRTDREVSFLLGEFRGEGKTGGRFVPAFEFSLTDGEGEPIEDRILEKGDTATVTVEFPLVGDFEAPGSYNGNVVVKSHGTLHLHLCIKVEGDAAAEAVSAKG